MYLFLADEWSSFFINKQMALDGEPGPLPTAYKPFKIKTCKTGTWAGYKKLWYSFTPGCKMSVKLLWQEATTKCNVYRLARVLLSPFICKCWTPYKMCMYMTISVHVRCNISIVTWASDRLKNIETFHSTKIIACNPVKQGMSLAWVTSVLRSKRMIKQRRQNSWLMDTKKNKGKRENILPGAFH